MTDPAARSHPPDQQALTGGRFAELSSVALVRAVLIDGRLLPKGTRGTVVAAYSDGLGYEVEFNLPLHAVATLDAADLHA